MLLYINSSKFNFPIRVYKLVDKMEHLKQAAQWAENKWGYLRENSDVTKRIAILSAMKNQFYVVLYDNSLLGMFALLDKESTFDCKAKELMYFYVDAAMRSMGVGSRMLVAAKKLAAQQGCNIIFMDTLTPALNQFYKKNGAKPIGGGRCLGAPTTVMAMDCHERVRANIRNIVYKTPKGEQCRITVKANAVTLQSSRLLFKSFDQEPKNKLTQQYTALLQDANTVKLLEDGKPWSTKKIATMIITERNRLNHDSFRLFSAYERISGQFIGCLCVEELPQQLESMSAADSVEIGYCIAETHWGRGYGSEIAAIGLEYIERIMCDQALSYLQKPKFLIGTAHPDNHGSLKILEKVFKYPTTETPLITRWDHPRRLFTKHLTPFLSAEPILKGVKSSFNTS